MQFDRVNFQQLPQTLQFQRCECVRRQSIRGIACDIRGQHPQRESYSAGSAAARAAARRRRRWRASGLTRRIPPVHTTCPSPTVTTQWATHRLPMKQAPTRGAASRPPRGHTQARDHTTISNTDCPAPASRQVTTQPTRCAHPPRRYPPPPTPGRPPRGAAFRVARASALRNQTSGGTSRAARWGRSTSGRAGRPRRSSRHRRTFLARP